MLQLVNIFDTSSHIELTTSKGDSHDTEAQLAVKAVGQEKDGSVLYTRHAPSPRPQNNDIVTYFEIFSMQDKRSKVVFMHENKINVINATINAEHTFLGYVTCNWDAAGSRAVTCKYKAFLAEIFPQNRVFDLNLEREFYIKLQFVYGLNDVPSSLMSRESSLLVFLHRDSIGLYLLPAACIGDKQVILNGEPRKQQIFTKLWWAQWHSNTQCLFALSFTRSGTRDSRHHTPMLTVIHVQPDSVVQKVMETALDLPIPYCKLSSRCSYENCGISNAITDRSINMSVLTQRNGAVCICYRHAAPILSPSNSGSETDTSDATSQMNSLTYSVSMLHHHSTLTVHCSNLSLTAQTHVFFSWIGEYVLAYVPGCFTHLLNVSVDIDPCNHILLDTGEGLSGGQQTVDSSNRRPSSLVPFIKEYRPGITKPALGMYNPDTGCAYKVTVDEGNLVSTFATSRDLTLKLAIMHFAVVHARDVQLIYNLCEAMCQDPASLDLGTLMQEFLIGGTFSQMRRKIDDRLLRCLPLTTAPVISSQMHSKHYRATYKPLHPKTTVVYDEVGGHATWTNLSGHLMKAQRLPSSRFDCSSVQRVPSVTRDTPTQLQREVKSDSEQSPPKQKQSPVLHRSFSAVSSSASGLKSMQSAGAHLRTPLVTQYTLSRTGTQPKRPMSRTELLLGTPPPFMSITASDGAELEVKMVKLLHAYLKKNQKQENFGKQPNIAEEYYKQQVMQSRFLCHMLWSLTLVGQSESETDAVSDDNYNMDMYMVYDKYNLVTNKISFPRPQGFDAFFMKLTYKQLPLRLFLQYIDSGALHLTVDFVKQLIKGSKSSEDEDTSQAIYQLITRLPQADAVHCLRKWNHPLAYSFIAQHYTRFCFKQEAPLGWEIFSMDTVQYLAEDETEHSSRTNYPPLSHLLRHMQHSDDGLRDGSSSCGLAVDSNYIRTAALVHTSQRLQSSVPNDIS